MRQAQERAFLTEPYPRQSIVLFPKIDPRRCKISQANSPERESSCCQINMARQNKRLFRINTNGEFRKLASEIREHDLESWLRITNRFPNSRWSIKEKRSLKAWFDRLDEDGSGEIDVDELADPLLSSGIVKTMAEVKELIQSVDDDSSGSIGFVEFLSIMRPKEKTDYHSACVMSKLPSDQRRNQRESSSLWPDFSEPYDWSGSNCNGPKEEGNYNLNPVAKLQEIQKHGDLDLKSILSLKRRNLLLDATVGEAQRREHASNEIDRLKAESRLLGGPRKRERIRELMHQKKVVNQRMEKAERGKQHFISAMERIISRSLAYESGET